MIVQGGKALCAKRGQGGTLAGLWEFPGGKVEAGESPKGALAREIHEELGCSIEVGAPITTTAHEYDFGVVELSTYYAQIIDGEPVAGEHEEIAWVSPANLKDLEWAPADIPAVEIVMSELK